MPRYIATEGRNVRRYQRFEFVAPDDAKALAYLKDCIRGDCIEWDGDAGSGDYGDAECEDSVVMLDKLQDGKATREEVACEILIPGVLYSRDAMAFIRKVAALAVEGAYDDAVGTLAALIWEASTLVQGQDKDQN